MRIFYDTNVILDVIANRPDFFAASARAVSVADGMDHVGLVSALTVSNIVYVLRKSMSADDVGIRIKELEEFLQIVDVTRSHVMTAFGCGMPDYEDAVQCRCAESANADVIVTRNPDDFVGSKIRVLTPSEFLKERILGYDERNSEGKAGCGKSARPV